MDKSKIKGFKISFTMILYFKILYKRAYVRSSKWLGGVVYEDPWLAGGHNGLSNNEDPILISQIFSRGRGVDGILIAASTDSDEVIHQAAQMCRKRGRIVLVGVVGLDLRRDDFYKKEITFQVSASYGPGRYDPFYEEQGNDYPIGFVRWTEQRNFEAVLDMMSSGKLNVKSLITHRYDIENPKSILELNFNIF